MVEKKHHHQFYLCPIVKKKNLWKKPNAFLLDIHDIFKIHNLTGIPCLILSNILSLIPTVIYISKKQYLQLKLIKKKKSAKSNITFWTKLSGIFVLKRYWVYIVRNKNATNVISYIGENMFWIYTKETDSMNKRR
jgi:hypothetical protein